MKIEFTKSFLKDLEAVRDSKLKAAIREVIQEAEEMPNLRSIQNISKLSGYRTYYRIKMGSYRIGLHFGGGILTFVAFNHRKDIYRHFPQ